MMAVGLKLNCLLSSCLRLRLTALLFALLGALAPHAEAHKASDAYLSLELQGEHVEERLDIALRDIDRDLTLDVDGDGRLTWGEVRSRWSDLRVLADQANWQLDGRACTLASSGVAQLDEHSDGRYAVLTRRWQCAPGSAGALTLSYHLFATTDPTHRGIVRIVANGQTQTAVLGPDHASQRFDLDGPHSGPTTLFGFIAEGIHHILIGTDHILFLLALLLPAVMVRSASTGGSHDSRAVKWPPMPGLLHRIALQSVDGIALLAPSVTVETRVNTVATEWQATPRLRPVVADVLRVVTAFTVAHSITLALAAFDVINPPSRWVESIIAASVVLAALNNVWPVVREGRWGITFAFGLVHGFGFAGALKGLGLGGGSLAWPLLGFNLGVELGQLAIVAIFLPLAWTLRGTRLYRQGLLKGGSIAIALLALAWLMERSFDIVLLP